MTAGEMTAETGHAGDKPAALRIVLSFLGSSAAFAFDRHIRDGNIQLAFLQRGLQLQDLAVAAAAVRLAIERGVAIEVDV